jgi:hypothetical protein
VCEAADRRRHGFGRCDRITVENEGGGIARNVNFVVISAL